MKQIEPDIWRDDFYHLSDLYAPITPSFKQLNYEKMQWPKLNEYQSLIESHQPSIINENKKSIKFVNQTSEYLSFKDQYEPRIHLEGEVQTRLDNWHDFFQVLVWHSFPKTKLLLNTLHFQASSERLQKNNNQRTAIENFLTLFDECGVVVVSTETHLLDMIRNFQWQSLFWDNRSSFNQNIECFTFGHAMYEKALNPYIGMTANALLILVEDKFFKLNANEKTLGIDNLIVKKIQTEKTLTPRILNPFPILGVPNWHNENSTLDFYLNDSYFRKGRTKPRDT